MARLSDGGLAVDVPSGWEAQIDPGTGAWGGDQTGPVGMAAATTGPTEMADGAVRRTVAHLANFPLAAGRGDFGGGAVESMHRSDVFISVFEHDPASAETALFAPDGVPRSLKVGDFDPAAMQREVSGGSAVQRFFHVGGRAFCIYVVVGNHIDRRDVLPAINEVLASLEIQ